MVIKDETAVASKVMDGKALAKEVRQRLKVRVEAHVQAGRRRPGLAVVLVGDDKASAVYVRNKVNSCKQAGIESFMHTFGGDTDEKTLLDLIEQLNRDELVDGILVQLPLPSHLSADRVLERLDPGKDVDGLTPFSMGLLFAGKPGLRACTPLGIMELLAKYNVPIEGANAVVIGRSNLVGKPIAMLLMQKNATVTMCHSKTRNMAAVTRGADILVAALGKREFIQADFIKPGAVVIDVGIHSTTNENGESTITGDVKYSDAVDVASLITPVPGGVGPMTVAMLLSNTVLAFERRFGLTAE